jgi:hypothetical protein
VLPDIDREDSDPILEASEDVEVYIFQYLSHSYHELALPERWAFVNVDLLVQVLSKVMHVRLLDLHRDSNGATHFVDHEVKLERVHFLMLVVAEKLK